MADTNSSVAATADHVGDLPIHNSASNPNNSKWSHFKLSVSTWFTLHWPRSRDGIEKLYQFLYLLIVGFLRIVLFLTCLVPCYVGRAIKNIWTEYTQVLEHPARYISIFDLYYQRLIIGRIPFLIYRPSERQRAEISVSNICALKCFSL